MVDNRPGAGGQIAAQALKSAVPDGTTLFLSNTHTIVTVPLTVASPGFAPSTDFRPIGTVANFELALAVHKRTGVKKLSELKAWLAAHSDEANIGVPAPTSAPEFIAGKLARAFRTKTVPVPYRGAAPMVQDLLAPSRGGCFRDVRLSTVPGKRRTTHSRCDPRNADSGRGSLLRAGRIQGA
ncbi:tripartite tricarboxylate transporter substrate-binding protein [Cupriavidus campinensis]|uniref:tripartite tricarboxylate transporter substrate-binding protein n=1 Tax=Cupriavidus campinensis TaxID=151783 RepID=UPI0024821A8B|nr:tripartite tricarboxylate transporter substrate-binding protein [Cupriavidus campinensis]